MYLHVYTHYFVHIIYIYIYMLHVNVHVCAELCMYTQYACIYIYNKNYNIMLSMASTSGECF